MADNRPISQRFSDAVETVAGKGDALVDKAAEGVETITGGHIDKVDAKGALPWIGGGLLAMAAVALFNPIKRISQKILSGFGMLEKVPVLGALVKGLSVVVAWAAPVVLAVAAFTFLKKRDDAPLSEEVKTAYHHTGRVADPTVTVKTTVVDPATGKALADVDVPQKPAEAPALAPETKAALKDLNLPEGAVSAARNHRTAAIAAGNEQVDRALQAYIGHYNQRYENTRDWVAKANLFRDKGPRDELVKALQATGLTEAEAQAAVPKPPALQETVYAKGDFPPDLTEFAKKFEATYGAHWADIEYTDKASGRRIDVFTFVDKEGDKPRHKTWDTMSVSQREEFLRKAIEFTKQRYDFFETKQVNTSFGDYPVFSYDYQDHAWKDKYWAIDLRRLGSSPDGYSFGIKWKDEHAFVKDVFKIKQNHTMFAGSYPEASFTYEQQLANWRSHEARSDVHRQVLSDAAPQIKAFGDEVTRFSARLQSLKEKRVMTVKEVRAGDRVDITLKDVRDPAQPRIIELQFGKIAEGKFALTAASEDGKPLALEPSAIDEPSAVTDWTAVIDKLRPKLAQIDTRAGSVLLSMSDDAYGTFNSPSTPGKQGQQAGRPVNPGIVA